MFVACCHIKWIIVFSLDRGEETKGTTRRGTRSRKKETLFGRTEGIKSIVVDKTAAGRYKGECSLHISGTNFKAVKYISVKTAHTADQ